MTIGSCLHAVTESAPSRRSRTVLQGDRAWIVEAGPVDLFVAYANARRHYLCRAAGGDMLFGTAGDDVSIEAAYGSDARLVEVECDAFVAGMNGAETAVAFAAALERAIDLIADIAGEARLRPQRPALGSAGLRMMASQRVDAQASDGLLWVDVVTGSARLCGNAALVVDAGALGPVSARTWLTLDPGAEVVFLSTADLVTRGRIGQALDAARSLWTRGVRYAVDETLRLERERQLAAIDATRHGLIDAFAQIASSAKHIPRPLGSGAVAWSSNQDALVAACRAIAHALAADVEPSSFPAGLSGAATSQAVDAIAGAWRLRPRRVTLRDGWWTRDQGPLLAFTAGDKRPVAVAPVGIGRYCVVDPSGELSGPIDRAMAERLAPKAFTFYRTFAIGTVGLRDLARTGLRGCGRDIAAIVAFGTLGSVLASALPIATGILISSVVPGAVQAHLLHWTLLVFACTSGAALLQVGRGLAAVRVEMRLGGALQAAMWDRLMRLPLRFFRGYSAGALAVRAMGIDAMRQTLAGAPLRGLLAGLFSFFSFALLFHYDPRAAIYAAALLAALMTATLVMARAQLTELRTVTRLRARTSGLVLQLLNGIAKLRVSGAEVRAFGVWARLFSEQRHSLYRGRVWASAQAVLQTIFPIAANVALFAVLIDGGRRGPTATGDVLAFMAAFTGCVSATLSTTSALITLMSTMPTYELMRPMLDTVPEASTGEQQPGVMRGEVAADRLVFRYDPDGPPVLQDVTFRVKAGQFVAFVGPTGSGKSTILRLLLGFEVPQSGAVYFDGLDLQRVDIRALRQQIGVVLQNGRLIPGDVYANIVGCTSATLDEAWEAARMVGLDEDIRRMPMGMHTVVTDGGGTLSGGQRQRLMIARAIVNRPRILLLDEATSSLDNRTQAVVSRSLGALQATRIVIAHRLSTIMEADCIFVLRAGRIVQTGRYADLIARPGPFADLARRQVL